MVTKSKKIFTLCNDCERETNQHLLFSKRVKQISAFDKKDIRISEFMTIECAGCKTVSFLQRDLVEDPDEPGKILFIDTNYPNDDIYMDEFNYLRDEDHQQLPADLYNLYEEITTAFENGNRILAGVGLRTLVEAICNHQKITGRNLQDKIKNLQVAGLISAAEHPVLDKLRQIGNDATHQLKALSLDKLGYALEIVNHVLVSIYILPKINKKLKLT